MPKNDQDIPNAISAINRIDGKKACKLFIEHIAIFILLVLSAVMLWISWLGLLGIPTLFTGGIVMEETYNEYKEMKSVQSRVLMQNMFSTASVGKELLQRVEAQDGVENSVEDTVHVY